MFKSVFIQHITFIQHVFSVHLLCARPWANCCDGDGHDKSPIPSDLASYFTLKDKFLPSKPEVVQEQMLHCTPTKCGFISHSSSTTNNKCRDFKNNKALLWLVWLSGLCASLQTKGSPVQFPVRAHAWVAGQVLRWGCRRGNHTLMFLSSFSLPPPV